MKKRLLILHPQASRTGSTKLLLSFLLWLREQSDNPVDVEVWTDEPGAMDRELGSVARLHVIGLKIAHDHDWRGKLARRLGIVFFGRWLGRLMLRKACSSADVIWINTVAAVPMARRVSDRTPVMLFVHELELSVARLLTKVDADWIFRRAQVVMASSRGVARDLAHWHGVPLPRSEVIGLWYCGPARIVAGESGLVSRRSKARMALSIDTDVQLIVAGGYMDWIKGPDLFVDVAAELKRLMPSSLLSFVWVGRAGDAAVLRFVLAYARERGVSECVQVIQEVDDMGNWLAAADALALTSRAESFSLLALEAGIEGTPVVYFNSAGGPGEFLQAPLGRAVNAIDTLEMAVKLRDSLTHSDEAASSVCAQAEALYRTMSVEVRAPRLRDRIVELMNAPKV